MSYDYYLKMLLTIILSLFYVHESPSGAIARKISNLRVTTMSDL